MVIMVVGVGMGKVIEKGMNDRSHLKSYFNYSRALTLVMICLG